MNYTNLKPEFIFSEGTPMLTKMLMKATFIQHHNKGAKALNPHYEDWNRQWDRYCNKYGISNDNHDEYIKFICKRQNRILNDIDCGMFELYTAPETEASIALRCKDKPEYNCNMILKEV